MSETFYKDLDTNFEQALMLCEHSFSHDELIELLKCGNLTQKHAAALNFDYIKSSKDAETLLSNLIGCDGKIREAVALSINRILNINPESKEFFCTNSANIFAKATIDINANICRLVIDSALILKDCKEFSQIYANKILFFATESLEELDKFIFRDKKYVINKQLFKLYWCLEALKYFYNYVKYDEIINVLKKSAEQNEYTIREKVAQIAILDDKFIIVRKILENDENYYVKQVLADKI